MNRFCIYFRLHSEIQTIALFPVKQAFVYVAMMPNKKKYLSMTLKASWNIVLSIQTQLHNWP